MSDTLGKENRATPAATLEQQILDPNHPKNDREWWAAAEIERLKAVEVDYDLHEREMIDLEEDNGRLTSEVDNLKSMVIAQEKLLRAKDAEIERLMSVVERVYQSSAQKHIIELTRAAITQEPT